MHLKKIKTYHLFWCVAALILLIGLFDNDPDSTLDINIHDTYFVIANLHVAVVLFLFYFLNGFGYWAVEKLLKKKLEKSLTLIHCIILIGSFVFYWLIVFYTKLFLPNPEFALFDNHYLINRILIYEFFLIIFVATPIYITNLLIGPFRKSNSLSVSK